MGVKGIDKNIFPKALLLIIFIAISFFLNLKTFSQGETAREKNTGNIVRIAVSDNNFKSIVYNQIGIFATSEYSIYEKESKKLIAKVLSKDISKIKFANGKFEISINNKTIVKDFDSAIVFECPKGVLGAENLKRAGKQALYHGIFELVPKNCYQFYLINVVDLQDYLKGVVPNEMPVRFGLEALKAQAVAARNYVLMPRFRAYKEFDVDDSVASQVYFGANTEAALATQAVNETEGLVALYGWDLILALYSSTAGGYTENYENAFSELKTKEFPAKEKFYLKGRPDIYSAPPLNREEEARIFYMSYPDSYDIKSPYYRWKKEWESGELKEVLQKTLIEQSKTGFVKPVFNPDDKIEMLKELRVKRRGVSGKIMELEIITDKQNYHVSKELVIRRVLQKNGVSLPSANAVFDNTYDADSNLIKVVAYGGGFGHGVGMSQYGAGFMAASLNKTFDKILKRYYTGITISTAPVILSSHESQKQLTQTFFAPEKKAVLVIDNKYQIKEFSANINGVTVVFEPEKSIIPFNRISRIDISEYIKQGRNKITFYFPDKNENKAIRLYIELVEKDDIQYNF